MTLSQIPVLLLLFVVLLPAQAVKIFPPKTPLRNATHGHVRMERQRDVLVNVPAHPDEHLVENLPLFDSTGFVSQWAGHLPASDNQDKYLFYWLFAPEEATSDAPLIIWLNGGPGCSSMDGLWLENGALKFATNKQHQYVVQPAEYSWHKAPAYTLYIDQPVGTGLSFTTSNRYPTNDLEVNTDFYYFLQSFFNLHRDKFLSQTKETPSVNRKVFFTGESHAGHYIPSMMNYILKQNQQLNGSQVLISLAGAAIGNGWVDPFYQYSAAEAAYGHGIIDKAQLSAQNDLEKECQEGLLQKQYTSGVCFRLLNDVAQQSFGASSSYTVSLYDVKATERTHGDRDYPPGHKVVESYLGGWPLKDSQGILPSDISSQVLEAIHATAASEAGHTYQECTDPPYNALAHQDGLGVVGDVVDILHHPDNIKLLFFNGFDDLICNHVGNERFLANLPWKFRDDWMQSSRYAWRAASEEKNKISGYMREYNNLLFLKILSAGHMVPLSVPNVAFDMIKTFVNGQSFDTSIQKLKSSLSVEPNCPVCPACPARGDSSSASKQPSDGDSNFLSFLLKYWWAFLLFSVFILLYTRIILSGFSYRKPQYVADGLEFDIELREETNGYRDDPKEDDNGIM